MMQGVLPVPPAVTLPTLTTGTETETASAMPFFLFFSA